MGFFMMRKRRDRKKNVRPVFVRIAAAAAAVTAAKPDLTFAAGNVFVIYFYRATP
jgi:hypothetical protein